MGELEMGGGGDYGATKNFYESFLMVHKAKIPAGIVIFWFVANKARREKRRPDGGGGGGVPRQKNTVTGGELSRWGGGIEGEKKNGKENNSVQWERKKDRSKPDATENGYKEGGGGVEKGVGGKGWKYWGG